ncbi:GNAT family N-acetyltransferase [uncultured Arthrobacter sp.]|uniref:GNAT family N-acetyltransferase n=1 Tax=uncultured Arthrobacter sp. TaxID=114050 RepID=UPI0025E7523A|nr:GNAT family protein [uncultured Arthrobacter sp.]
MTPTANPWRSSAAGAGDVRLVRLPPAAIHALADGDLAAAQLLSPAVLTEHLVSSGCRAVWRMRSRQLLASPGDADWITRLIVDAAGTAVGRAGFHGPPDDGRVEVGYEVDPGHRRRGHARAALGILLGIADAEPGVSTVRASVRPDNLPSRRLVDSFGFRAVGRQWDEDDGWETVLELSLT